MLCSVCGDKNPKNTHCIRCGTDYCSPECQKKDLPAHKQFCKKTTLANAARPANDASDANDASNANRIGIIGAIQIVCPTRRKVPRDWPQAWVAGRAATPDRFNALCRQPQAWAAIAENLKSKLEPGLDPVAKLISDALPRPEAARVHVLQTGISVVIRNQGNSSTETQLAPGDLYKTFGDHLGNYIGSLANLAFVVELLWLGPGWVALVFGNHNNPLTVHICKVNDDKSLTVHVNLTFPKRPKTTVPLPCIKRHYCTKFVYVFGACALPSSGHLLLGFENDGESSIIAIPIEKVTEVKTTISVTDTLPKTELSVVDTVHVGAMQVEPLFPVVTKALGMTAIGTSFLLVLDSNGLHKFQFSPRSPMDYMGLLYLINNNNDLDLCGVYFMSARAENDSIHITLSNWLLLFEGWFNILDNYVDCNFYSTISRNIICKNGRVYLE